jgi:hypothetical protein
MQYNNSNYSLHWRDLSVSNQAYFLSDYLSFMASIRSSTEPVVSALIRLLVPYILWVPYAVLRTSEYVWRCSKITQEKIILSLRIYLSGLINRNNRLMDKLRFGFVQILPPECVSVPSRIRIILKTIRRFIIKNYAKFPPIFHRLYGTNRAVTRMCLLSKHNHPRKG